MPPIVHLVRHAQARSNADPAAREELDPELTEIGMQQARDLACAFPCHENIKAVLVSPLQRALQTALLAFEPTLKHDAKVVALPLAQETSHAPCDTGRDLDALKAAFGDTSVDWSHVERGWNSKTGIWAQDDAVVEQRAVGLRDFLASLSEQEVVLVTHGFFLHFLTEDWSELEKNGDFCGFEHCEYRSYSLEDVQGHYKLREISASREKRRRPLTD